jgi:protein-disulfide isomerase
MRDAWRLICFVRVSAMHDLTHLPPVGPDDHYLGPVDAPVTLIQYGDYECPHCGRAHQILPGVLERLGDRVRYVYRHFPLIDIHPEALFAAEAAESVAVHGGEEAFWDMHHMLFANQDALEIDGLLGYAEATGVDPETVAEDLSSRAERRRVRADVDGGLRCGVSGTPTFFINGTRYEGNWTNPDEFAAALAEAAAARQD